MNKQLENKFDEKTVDLIINAAYGSANLFQKIEVWLRIKKSGELEHLYNEYKSTAQSVHSLEKEELPKHVLQRIESETKVDLSGRESSLFANLTSILFERPQIIFATTAVIIGLIVSSMLINQPKEINTAPYTALEIQLANKQAKEALALVGKILTTTQTALTEEIIPNKVVKPINESFEYVNEILKKGDI